MSSELTLVDVSDATAEARRVMTICNACRYCEGFCPVFPAMTLRSAFTEADLDYLANLCHNCTACYHACQYKPPHEFDLNAPQALARVRATSYEKYAWPPALAQVFAHNGLFVSLVTAIAFAGVFGLTLNLVDPDALYAEHTSPGAFYAVISHGVMVAVGGGTFMLAIAALIMGGRRFWRASGLSIRAFLSTGNWLAALRAAATLEHLGGGHGEGCNSRDESFSNLRRVFHQFTMWGFLLCFAATCTATVYELGLGRMSPFPLLSLPVMLGCVGGIGLLVGPAGLVWVKLTSDPAPMLTRTYGMDYAFLALLFLVSLTGLVLLALRETSAMGLLLAVHLGFVLAFFLTLPYSKFVHGMYRFMALLRYADETRAAR